MFPKYVSVLSNQVLKEFLINLVNLKLHKLATLYLCARYCLSGSNFIIDAFSCRNSLKSVIQGFLPGIALKIFLILLPMFLMTMSKIEGHISISGLDRRTASTYFMFLFVNVFLGSVITGTAFQQLDTFIHQPANK